LLRHHRFVAKFICTCGSLVRTSGAIPNPNEWHLIADKDFDPDLSGMDLLGYSILAWRCAACGRLWLEAGRVKDGKRPETLWEFVPAFDAEGPLAPREAAP
jgi:rubredoxin